MAVSGQENRNAALENSDFQSNFMNYEAKIKKIKFKKLGRKIKKLYYQYLGSGGDKLFILLRRFKLLVRIEPFNAGEVKSILIIRLDRIGDVLLSTPTFRAVREAFPQSEISLLVRSYTKDLVIKNPHISEIISLDDRWPLAIEVIRKAMLLRKKDLVVVLNRSFWANFFSFVSRAKYRIGYDAKGAGFFLTTQSRSRSSKLLCHEVESALDVVRSIGIDTQDKNLTISASEVGEKFAEGFLMKNAINRDSLLVAIHPAARYPYMRWSEEGFAVVSDYLIRRYAAKVIIIASAGEKDLVNRVTSYMNYSPIVLAGKTTLSELVSLLKRCRLFIGNSSGPMHIASALKVPVIAIFGNVHPADHYLHWGPWGEGQEIVSKNLDCSDCYPADCLKLDCMKLISAADVMCKVDSQLQRIGDYELSVR